MSTGDHPVGARTSVRWAIPAVAALGGLGYLIAGWVGGNLGFGVVGVAIMLVAAAGFLVAARWSDTLAGLRSRTDERINSLDATASLFAGMVVFAAVLVMFMVELAQGRDGSPYYQLGALGGVAYLAALVFLRFRR